MILWSADLIRTRGAVRWTGVLGTLAGAAPVIALSSDILRLDVGGMTAVLASWAAWFVAVGALMIQRKV
jgi:hypothetical protein